MSPAWMSDCCEAPALGEVSDDRSGVCSRCKGLTLMYDEHATADDALGDIPLYTPMSAAGLQRLLSDFERDTIRRNREKLAAADLWRARMDEVADMEAAQDALNAVITRNEVPCHD